MADLACPLPFSAECPMLGSIPQALKESQAPLKLSPTLACSVLMVFSSSRRWRVKVSRGLSDVSHAACTAQRGQGLLQRA